MTREDTCVTAGAGSRSFPAFQGALGGRSAALWDAPWRAGSKRSAQLSGAEEVGR